jgi:Xaa-Pro aminopeptidase
VEQAVREQAGLPTEAELAALVSQAGTAIMYAEHDDVVVVPHLAGGLVYSGPNSARPHALPSGRRLAPGEPFMLSLGAGVGGRRCCDVNAECLAVIHEAGLAHYLRHRQGHGIGINIHEPPWLEDGDSSELTEAMIVSDEPGLYVPGLGGYRISDSVLVGSGGGEPLAAYPKNLDAVVIAL